MNVSWDVAISARAELGERPFWDAATGSLMWVDILAGHLHRYRPGVSDSVFHTAGVAVGAAAPRAGGGYVLAAADGFRLVGADGQPDGGPWRPPGMLADIRFNDGACDPAGRFWAGTVALDRRPGAGALYRLDPSGEIAVVLDGVTESNGLGWSPDGGTFYFIDSGEPRPRIRSFPCDLAAGTLGAPRDLVQPPAAQGIGRPDRGRGGLPVGGVLGRPRGAPLLPGRRTAGRPAGAGVAAVLPGVRRPGSRPICTSPRPGRT